MKNESWARVSLCIAAPREQLPRIEELLGRANESQADGLWMVDLQEASTQPVHEQLGVVRDFLEAHLDALREIVEWSQVNVQLSWSPRDPQDGLILDQEFVRLLAVLRAYVLIDTYAD